MRDEGRNPFNIKAHREVCPTSTYGVKVDDLLTVNNRESRVVCGGRGAPEVNNLVFTKRQKHIYANSTHETTYMDGWMDGLIVTKAGLNDSLAQSKRFIGTSRGGLDR